tara:strand:+ start:607 stop:1017 length:411 start_codon:yes stop_codon:yes gene_type:complete
MKLISKPQIQFTTGEYKAIRAAEYVVRLFDSGRPCDAAQRQGNVWTLMLLPASRSKIPEVYLYMPHDIEQAREQLIQVQRNLAYWEKQLGEDSDEDTDHTYYAYTHLVKALRHHAEHLRAVQALFDDALDAIKGKQ